MYRSRWWSDFRCPVMSCVNAVSRWLVGPRNLGAASGVATFGFSDQRDVGVKQATQAGQLTLVPAELSLMRLRSSALQRLPDQVQAGAE